MSLKPERELGVRDNLSLTRTILDRSFLVFVLPIFAANLAYEALRYASRPFFPDYLIDPAAIIPGSMDLVSLLVGTLGLLTLLGFYSAVTSTLGYAVCTVGTVGLLEGRPLRLGPSVNSVIRRTPVLMAAGLVTLVASTVLTLLLVVPGLAAQTVFSILIPVVIAEERRVVSSLRRCWDLVEGRITATLTLWLVLNVFLVAASFVASMIVGGLGFEGDLAIIPFTALTSLVAPVLPISFTVHYYSLLSRQKSGG